MFPYFFIFYLKYQKAKLNLAQPRFLPTFLIHGSGHRAPAADRLAGGPSGTDGAPEGEQRAAGERGAAGGEAPAGALGSAAAPPAVPLPCRQAGPRDFPAKTVSLALARGLAAGVSSSQWRRLRPGAASRGAPGSPGFPRSQFAALPFVPTSGLGTC